MRGLNPLREANSAVLSPPYVRQNYGCGMHVISFSLPDTRLYRVAKSSKLVGNVIFIMPAFMPSSCNDLRRYKSLPTRNLICKSGPLNPTKPYGTWLQSTKKQWWRGKYWDSTSNSNIVAVGKNMHLNGLCNQISFDTVSSIPSEKEERMLGEEGLPITSRPSVKQSTLRQWNVSSSIQFMYRR